MNAPDSESLYLALDQGGHASRALVFDTRGRVVARAMREVQVFHPQPDWVEHDPDELAGSLNEVILEVRRGLGPRAAQLAGAGLATQRSSIVCWDRISGAALSPVLSWQDRRTHAWLARLAPQAEAVQRATGLRLSPHYGASKLRWCLDHLPAVAQAAADRRLAFGPLASFLVFRLTEERSLLTDPANGARTLLLNRARLDWDEGLLHLFDLPRAALPDVVPTRFQYGHLVAGRRLPLEVVTGDQSAALFAGGAPRPDSAYLNLGTGAFVQRCSGRDPGHAARLLSGIALQDRDENVYVLEGTVNGAGSALAWATGELRLNDLDARLNDWLAISGDEPPLFLNGVSGLGAPFWVADFESRFIGGGSAERKAVAVAESIVFLIQSILDELHEPATPLARLVASGGLTRHGALCQRISDLSGLPLHRPSEHEATARGLAWLLAGKPRDWPEPAPGTDFQPQPNNALRTRYLRWQQAMQLALRQTGI